MSIFSRQLVAVMITPPFAVSAKYYIIPPLFIAVSLLCGGTLELDCLTSALESSGMKSPDSSEGQIAETNGLQD